MCITVGKLGVYERGYTSDSEIYQQAEDKILRKDKESDDFSQSDEMIFVILNFFH